MVCALSASSSSVVCPTQLRSVTVYARQLDEQGVHGLYVEWKNKSGWRCPGCTYHWGPDTAVRQQPASHTSSAS